MSTRKKSDLQLEEPEKISGEKKRSVDRARRRIFDMEDEKEEEKHDYDWRKEERKERSSLMEEELEGKTSYTSAMMKSENKWRIQETPAKSLEREEEEEALDEKSAEKLSIKKNDFILREPERESLR